MRSTLTPGPNFRDHLWQQIWAILTRPLFLISGVIILYEDMPRFAQQVLWYNPILHLTGMMRDGFYPMYRPEYISLVFVALCMFIPMVAGLLLLKRYHRELLNR
jgi:capsular polysaccharide transport system permease protein